MFKLISDVPVRQESDYGWHALYTQHRHEKAVAHIPFAQGVRGFPTASTGLCTGGKTETSSSGYPSFPATSFSRADLKGSSTS